MTAVTLRTGPDVAARDRTHCRACNLAIRVGQLICRTTADTYEHAHHHTDDDRFYRWRHPRLNGST